MARDLSSSLRERLAEAIGGREKALSVEKASGGRFQRKRLQSWIDGETSPPVAELIEFAKFLGKDPDFFLLSDQSRRENFVPIQKLAVHAAAGSGALNSRADVEAELEFPAWMIRALGGNASKLRILRAHGDSMEPLIHSGALLLVDESVRDHRKPPKPRGQCDHTDIFVFLQGDDVRVKRLRLDPKGATIAVSEHPSYGPEILRKQDFKVLGRVIWWDNRL